MDKTSKLICEDCGEILMYLGCFNEKDKIYGSIGEASKEIICKNCGTTYYRYDETGKNGNPGKSIYKKK